MKLFCGRCGEQQGKIKQDHRRKRFVAQCGACGLEEESVHGRHWKAFTKAYRGAAQGAGAGPGAPAAFRSTTFPRYPTPRAGQFWYVDDSADDDLIRPIPTIPSPFFSPSPFRAQTISGLLSSFLGSAVEVTEPKLEVCAPEVGEIIGWRYWRLRKGALYSASLDHVWVPGEVMEGNVEAVGQFGVMQGIYAHKNLEGLVRHARTDYDTLRAHYLLTTALVPKEERSLPKLCYVLGSVSLWGAVVEHERGYRAQYARIASFTGVISEEPDNETLLTGLRALYGVDG